MRIKKPLFKITTLRSFITFIVAFIVALSLLITGTYFYIRSAKILTKNYKNNIVQQLKQINSHVEDQIYIIDSFFPLILSNPMIQENLEPFISLAHSSAEKSQFQIEKQITQLLISTELWNEKFINSVSIIDRENTYYRVSLYNQITTVETLEKLLKKLPSNSSSLEIKTLNQDKESLYFLRNIFSIYTGEKIGTIVIDINIKEWENSYLENLDENWEVYLFNKEMQPLGYKHNTENSILLSDYISKTNNEISLEEISLNHTVFFIASKQLEKFGVTSVVAVPKNYILSELNQILKSFLTIFFLLLAFTVLFAASFSRTITLPIKKMIDYVRKASKGDTKEKMPKYLYGEFNEFADAFDSMLKQLDIYYNEIYQKQLLLKNAKIESLQAQINPHFLFNVLDTIAWKAQISENEEIYQMILSLAELLRGNILAKEKDFVTLEEELQYVKFYTYLQQVRFEDKFSIHIQASKDCLSLFVPRFCIQPLVENAIVHGLEPKKEFGKLRINIIRQKQTLEVIVIDNGVGFPETFQINECVSSKNDSHTHIGLKNLDKRLSLLYNENCHLKICSIPHKYTAVSFQIPLQTEE